MNKIEYETKLDFKDVLIRPKRSTISTRSQVSLNRSFKFKYSTKNVDIIPLIAANMDTTGTIDVYNCVNKHNIITALHKFYTVDNLSDIGESELNPNLFMISTGISDNDFEKLVN